MALVVHSEILPSLLCSNWSEKGKFEREIKSLRADFHLSSRLCPLSLSFSLSSITSTSASSKSSSISLSDLPSRALELANQAEEAALKTIEAEQREARKAKLPAFWLPSLTPSQKEGNVSISDLKKSLTTRCKISEHGHPMTSKNLIDVKFTLAASSGSTNQDSNSNGPQTICPSCKKGLSNSSTLISELKCGLSYLFENLECSRDSLFLSDAYLFPILHHRCLD